MNTTKLIVTALASGVLLTGCATEKSARNKLLGNTPIGTNTAGVLAYCKEAKLDCLSSSQAGYYDQRTHKAVGATSIRTERYEYKLFPLVTKSVEAYWGFDSAGKLVDIEVYTSADSQ